MTILFTVGSTVAYRRQHRSNPYSSDARTASHYVRHWRHAEVQYECGPCRAHRRSKDAQRGAAFCTGLQVLTDACICAGTCYKTHAYGSLEPELQSFARRALGTEAPRPTMKCLTLMATVGQSAAWNSRHFSRGHKTVPLPSPEIVEKAPMISQLIKELGLELSSVLQPSSDVVTELAGKRHGVFHVENALGSPYIPAQEDFVVQFGIRSVVGFGGMLATGDLFAVILFATVPVPSSAANRFKTVALDVKSAFSRFNDANVFHDLRPATSGSFQQQE